MSKAYGELMGRLYWFKHGVESVIVRIGSCFPEPTNARMLATWLSYPDLSRLMERCVLTEQVGHARDLGRVEQRAHDVVAGRCAARLGWAPIDSADPFAGQLAGKVSGDPVEERYMGGGVLLDRLFARRAGAAATVR